MHDDTAATTDGQTAVRLLGYSDLESAYDDPDRVGALATAIETRRDDRTLVVGAGDNTALGVLALLTDESRAQARPFFEAVEPVADTFGNHDFDFGAEWAGEWARNVPPTYCCANVSLSPDGPDSLRVPDATVVERDGVRVGVVGVAHPDTADICGTVADLTFGDPVAAASDALADLDVDYRVVLAHCGAEDPRVAREVDADVVLGGHLHSRRADRFDGTLLVRTSAGGTELAEVALGAESTVEFHEVDPGSFDAAAERTDPTAAAVADTYRERRRALGVDEVVARVEDPLPRTERERFGGESRVGNFAADAMRAATGAGTVAADGGESDDGGETDSSESGPADLGLFPGGSVRTGDPLAGAVTIGDVVSVCPFGGPVVECELDGADLRAVLEEAAHPHDGDRGWVQFHVSGGRVVWTDANDLASVTIGGEPLDPTETYRVATPEYVVFIDAFAPLSRESAVAEHDEQWRALVSHAREGGLDVDCGGRIARVSAGTRESHD